MVLCQTTEVKASKGKTEIVFENEGLKKEQCNNHTLPKFAQLIDIKEIILIGFVSKIHFSGILLRVFEFGQGCLQFCLKGMNWSLTLKLRLKMNYCKT